MNPVLRPVGPEESSVYWRRRIAALVVLVALALAVFLVVRLLTGGGDAAAAGASGPAAGTEAGAPADGEGEAEAASDGEPSGAPETAAASEDEAAADSAADSSGEPPACEAGGLQVTATADGTTYEAGAEPTLGVLIRNAGDEPCSLDAGSAAVELMVVSGSDRIWSSDDCQENPTTNPQTMKPGDELASSVVWPVQRSAEGCPADLPAPKPGTYQLTGRVGDLTSEPLAFTIS